MRRSMILPTLLLALVGCGDGEGTGPAFISAKIDGTAFSAEAQDGQMVYTLEVPDADGIYAAASRLVGSDRQFLSLVLPMPLQVGDYPLDGTTVRLAYQQCPSDVQADCIQWRAVAEHPGTLSIDRVDSANEMVEGRFSAVAYVLGNPAGTTKPILYGRFRIHTPGVFTQE